MFLVMFTSFPTVRSRNRHRRGDRSHKGHHIRTRHRPQAWPQRTSFHIHSQDLHSHSCHSPDQDRSHRVHHIQARHQPQAWPQHRQTSSSCPTVRIRNHHRLGVRNHRVLHIHTRRQPQSQQTSCRIQHSRIRHRLE